MIDNEHKDRSCEECMHLQDSNGTNGYMCSPTGKRDSDMYSAGKIKLPLPGAQACGEFKESVAAQHVQQLRMANKIAINQQFVDIALGTTGGNSNIALEAAVDVMNKLSGRI